jgi:hypothetical protein
MSLRRSVALSALFLTSTACTGRETGPSDVTAADATADADAAGAETAPPDTATDDAHADGVASPEDVAVADDASPNDAAAPSCDDPPPPTTPTPATIASATSNYNVTARDCTRSAFALACELGAAHAYDERVEGQTRLITANGVPSHDVGDFPNPDNPNTIAPQSYSFSLPVTPSGPGTAATRFGLTLAGALLDPGTAERWNDSTSWSYEALRYATAPDHFGTDATRHPSALGVDCNFAHVQPGGSYHYHGVPTGLMPVAPALTFVGWAGDGYPIFARWGHRDPADQGSELVELRASYRLKSGTRPSGTSGPGGAYDGTFVQDWEYVPGHGDLDACNGRTGLVAIRGETLSTYHYVLTHTYPYIPRCFSAAPSASFLTATGGGGPGAEPGNGGGTGGGAPPACQPGQTRCCGDDLCDGPENATNCPADCP